MKDQLDGFSFEAQAENIHKYTLERHWKLIPIYTDAGVSAKTVILRRALQFQSLNKRENQGWSQKTCRIIDCVKVISPKR